MTVIESVWLRRLNRGVSTAVMVFAGLFNGCVPEQDVGSRRSDLLNLTRSFLISAASQDSVQLVKIAEAAVVGKVMQTDSLSIVHLTAAANTSRGEKISRYSDGYDVSLSYVLDGTEYQATFAIRSNSGRELVVMQYGLFVKID
jgi:hypothetical protein